MKNRKAFTLVELVFVIVIIGVLSAVAIPKLAVTRNDADISVGSNTLAAVRSAIATERQKRILRGDFTAITDLDADGVAGTMFSTFNADGNSVKNRVLEYPVKAGNNNGEWSKANTNYTFHFLGGPCTFVLQNNTLQVKSGTANATACSKMGF